MKKDYVIVFCSVASHDEAMVIAKTIVEKKIAACVNIIPQVQSVYLWDNKLHTDHEVLCIIKAMTKNYVQIENIIKELHSYDCPEIIAVNISLGADKYLQWISQTAT